MSPFNRSFLWSHQRNVIAVTASHWNSVFLCLVQSFIINSIIFLIQIVSGSNLGYYWDSELLRIPLEIAHLGERICRLCEFYVHPLKVPHIVEDWEALWNPLQWNLNMASVFKTFLVFGHHRMCNQLLKPRCWRTGNVTTQRAKFTLEYWMWQENKTLL